MARPNKNNRYTAFAVAFQIEWPPRSARSKEFRAAIERLRAAMRESQRLSGTLVDEHHLADAAQCAEDLLAILRRARASKPEP